MTLPGAGSRTRFHTRTMVYECYRRDDGLWDIDSELTDVKDYAYTHHGRTVPAYQPIHNMLIRLTLDDSLTIREIVANSAHAPFGECSLAIDPMHAMVGVKIGRGWRKEIDRRLGGVKGCTHLRDLLFNAGTAAYQSITAHELHERSVAKRSAPAHHTPHFLGKCVAWALDGPVVKEHEPNFYVPPAREHDSES